jgi:hypothetical protein
MMNPDYLKKEQSPSGINVINAELGFRNPNIPSFSSVENN